MRDPMLQVTMCDHATYSSTFLTNLYMYISVLQLFTLPLCPESPKHLLLDRDDEGRAETALKWLRGKVDVRGELGEMR